MLTQRQRLDFLAQYEVCPVCGSGHELTVDHIVPRYRGGGDEPENLQPLCRSCNSQKQAKPHERWLKYEARHPDRPDTRNGNSIAACLQRAREKE